MRHTRRPAFCRLLVLAILVTPSVAAGQSETQSWTVPRTADGQPDMQGVWANNSATPLERPEALAEKATLSDEELADLKQAAARLFGDGGDAAFADGVFEAALAGVDNYVSGDGGSGNYSTVWMVDRDFENRTSLITDPSNGGCRRSHPRHKPRSISGGANEAPRSGDGPEDLTRQVRCITYSVPRSAALGPDTTATIRSFRRPTTSSSTAR